MYFVIFITSVYLSNLFALVCMKVCDTIEYGSELYSNTKLGSLDECQEWYGR